jgi:hypothetical protein
MATGALVSQKPRQYFPRKVIHAKLDFLILMESADEPHA